MQRGSEHDYVVVGAGSAGCVLAARLSAAGASVLVLEAGGSDRVPGVRVPAAFSTLFRTARDWNYAYEDEPGAAGRSLYVPRGRMLGGSSSINAMIYIRGNRADYDGWAEAGAKGWAWDDVLPYFRRAEDNERGADLLHGAGGPLRVSDQRSINPLTRRFVEAAVAAGIPATPDFNGPSQDGVGPYQVTQRRGRRWSAADAYLRPARRNPGLSVVTGATVSRVVVDHGAAVGVEYRDAGGPQLARARREVLLAAGAFNTPQLLLLSGIGPAAHLREVGVDVVADSPHVGEHLQDHPVVLLSWEVNARGTLLEAQRPASVARYLLTASGLLSSNIAEGGAFLRTDPALAAPDIQLHMAPGFFADHGFVTHPSPAISIGPTLVTPRSRGRVRLRSTDPTASPWLTSGVLTERADVDALLAGMARVEEIAATQPLAGIRGARIAPGPGVTSTDDLEDYLRHNVEFLYHPCGTARMGAEGDGVVDPELRVQGVDRLRVVDASVMPTVPRGNTNAATIMIAERAVDLLLDA